MVHGSDALSSPWQLTSACRSDAGSKRIAVIPAGRSVRARKV